MVTAIGSSDETQLWTALLPSISVISTRSGEAVGIADFTEITQDAAGSAMRVGRDLIVKS